MEKVYIIVQANAYDAFELPEDDCYLSKEQAQKQCDKINKFYYGENKKYWSYDVHELYLKK